MKVSYLKKSIKSITWKNQIESRCKMAVQDGIWTHTTLWKSVKIQKISGLVGRFFSILIPFGNIFLIFRPSGIWWKNNKENRAGRSTLKKDILLPISWPNPYNYLTAVVPTSQARSWHFLKVWPEFVRLSKMATLTPKSSV